MERYDSKASNLIKSNPSLDIIGLLLQFLATVFVIVNLFGQLGGCVMVMGRLKVEIACGLLFFIVVLQVSIHADAVINTIRCSRTVYRHINVKYCFVYYADCSLLNSMGYSIFTSKFGADWCTVTGAG